MAYKQIQVKPRSFIGSLIAAVIATFLYYVIVGIFKVIFWPFRFLSMSDEQIFEEEKEAAKKKIENREDRMKYYRSESGPLTDPKYSEWYKEWAAGKVLDSRMQWAPDVYGRGLDTCRDFNPVFLKYLEIQVGLHAKAPWVNKVMFRKTIRGYYPEFSIEGLSSEIESIQGRAEAAKLTTDLAATLLDNGLGFRVIQRLLAKKYPANELSLRVANIKAGLELGYGEGAAVTVDELGLKAGSDEADAVDGLIKECSKKVPAYVGIALAKNEIDYESLAFLAKRYESFIRAGDPMGEIHEKMLFFLNNEKVEALPRIRAEDIRKEHGIPVWEKA